MKAGEVSEYALHSAFESLKKRLKPGATLPRSHMSDRGRLLCLIAREPGRHLNHYALRDNTNILKFSSALSGLRESKDASTTKRGKPVPAKVALVRSVLEDIGKSRNYRIELNPEAFHPSERPKEHWSKKLSGGPRFEAGEAPVARITEEDPNPQTLPDPDPPAPPQEEPTNHIQQTYEFLEEKKVKLQGSIDEVQAQITNLVNSRDLLQKEMDNLNTALESLLALLLAAESGE